MISNKENFAPALMGSHKFIAQKSDKVISQKPKFTGKDTRSNGRGGMFDRLLTEATEEIKENLDQSVAVKYALNEARELAAGWKVEAHDYQVAKIMANDIEEEIRAQMLEDESLGEMEAIRIAIEERRCALYEENYKKELLANDIAYANRLLSEEADAKAACEKLCEEDAEYAKQVEKQLNDEELALKLHNMELKEMEDYRLKLKEIEAKDFELATKEQKEIDGDDVKSKSSASTIHKDEGKDCKGDDDDDDEADCKTSRNKHIDDDDDAKSMVKKSTKKKDTPVNHQEMLNKDEKHARRMMRQIAREKHRDSKRKYLNDTMSAKAYSDLSIIGKFWEEAEADIDDVEGGICITVILPHLLDVKVGVGEEVDNEIIIEAKRFVIKSDEHASVENSYYIADFVIDGVTSLTEDDLSYEYSSESGMLHVYVDNVSLCKMLDEGPKKSQQVVDKIMQSYHRLFQ